MAYPTFKFPCVPDFVWICFPPSLRLSTFFKNGWETVHTGTRPMKTCCVLVLHHVRGVSFWIRFLLEWKKISWKSSSRFHLPGKFCLSDGVIFFVLLFVKQHWIQIFTCRLWRVCVCETETKNTSGFLMWLFNSRFSHQAVQAGPGCDDCFAVLFTSVHRYTFSFSVPSAAPLSFLFFLPLPDSTVDKKIKISEGGTSSQAV